MASRAVNFWRSLAKSRVGATQRFSTATAPRMKPFAPAAADLPDHHHVHDGAKHWWVNGEFVPVYVVLGLIVMSLSLGAHTAKQQLAYSPGVRVSKKRRETVPEVVEPDRVVEDADRFVRKSLFRRVAHIQDFDAVRAGIGDPTRSPDPFNRSRRVEDLRSVGVDPRAR